MPPVSELPLVLYNARKCARSARDADCQGGGSEGVDDSSISRQHIELGISPTQVEVGSGADRQAAVQAPKSLPDPPSLPSPPD